ncbi:hypothetical protein K32_25850 [Kaistia sp. 32K]|uniref:nuclear transport factor 2 family protein n=1 Tax=Kaistia sp. 32K TaxID=2795690 RepID=UPI0019167762|nr:nuclear transport factor 2 family protein [Kaistia sp. 32K]BCP53968.1 hypothetical protein K32_25850 [Kaistia sp. 32K]
MTTNKTTELSSFSDMLQRALGPLLDPAAGDFVEMMAPDGVMEFPYAPAGYVRRIEGREALAAYLGRFVDILAIDRMTDPTVHFTRDADVVILEFGCEGLGLKTGQPYDQRYISVITLKDGRIARYRDYWNPLVVIDAVGGLDALNAALGRQ